MPRQRIKVYEEKRGPSFWVWIIPVVIVLGLTAAFFLRHREKPLAAIVTRPTSLTLPELGTIQFEPGKANLTPDGQATLDRAVESMRGNPNVRLRLEGYTLTPARGKRTEQLRTEQLSEQRTQAVTRYLDTAGIDKSRLTGGSFGKPSAGDSTPKKSDERRVGLYVR